MEHRVRSNRRTAKEGHTTPLFVEEKLLKVQEIFKLKLLKFYYKLCNNLLPPYFDSYRDVIDREPPRTLRQHFIHQPMIKRSYAECTPLFQLIKLINAMRRDPTDTIITNNSPKQAIFLPTIIQYSKYIFECI